MRNDRNKKRTDEQTTSTDRAVTVSSSLSLADSINSVACAPNGSDEEEPINVDACIDVSMSETATRHDDEEPSTLLSSVDARLKFDESHSPASSYASSMSSELSKTTMAADPPLTDADHEVMTRCAELLVQTFEREPTSIKRELTANSPLDYNEFTQTGVRDCLKFCMNLIGNNDLGTDDRAKLLKYGVYEIAVC